MKTHTLMKMMLITLFALSITACNKSGEDNQNNSQQEVTDESGEALPIVDEVVAQKDTALEAHVHFACPMECRNNTMYDEDILCPECDMKLYKVKHEGH
jgi:hypothetical protein